MSILDFPQVPIVEDDKIPQRFRALDVDWLVLDKMRNHFTRVLASPIWGTGAFASGAPRWFSNAEMAKIIEEMPHGQESK